MTIPAPPAALARDLLAGTRLVAGLGHSTVLPSMDFETYSEAGFEWNEERKKWAAPKGAPGNKRGLKLVGAAVYAQHPSTEVLCLAYNLKDGRGPRLWLPGTPPPSDLLEYLAGGGLIEAWNAPFEYWVWNEVCVRRYGFPPLPAHQFRCVMAKARAFALPGKLEEAARVLNVPIQKDKDGTRLLDKFSVPRNPTKDDPRRRILPSEDPDDAKRLYSYCLTDIDAEDEVAARVPDLEGEELDYYLVDQAINRRGLGVDSVGVEACIAIIEQAHARYNGELRALTGGAVSSASEVKKLAEWLAERGVRMESMDEDAVTAALKQAVPDDARRALEIRQVIGAASVMKTFSMRFRRARGDRVHDLFSYHAARTGRPTGNNPQPTNMAKAGPQVVRCGRDGRTQFAIGCGRYHGAHLSRCPWCGVVGPPGRKAEWCAEAAADALDVIRTGSLPIVETVFKDAMLTVSGCTRSLFVAGPERQLVASDFTAIEAVVIAELAGERWRREVFAAGTDIYLESISRSTGTPLAELLDYRRRTGMHHPLRQDGKVQELSLGYGGWLGALRAFGAKGTDDELKQQILAWRAASPAIVEFWGGQTRDFGRSKCYFGLEGAAVTAMMKPGEVQHAMRLDGSPSGVSFLLHAGILYMQLPGGRRLTYHRPKLTRTGTWRGFRLTFEGWNTNQKKGKPGWQVMDLYGGLLAENATQAVARDIQRRAQINAECAGLPVVLHVYDENVAEVGPGRTVEEIEACMMDLPEFAKGWPIKAAGGWAGERYRKA